jgi:hypothetical protein
MFAAFLCLGPNMVRLRMNKPCLMMEQKKCFIAACPRGDAQTNRWR